MDFVALETHTKRHFLAFIAKKNHRCSIPSLGVDVMVYVFQNGWTSLHFAAKAGYLTVVKLLIESGASPKFESKDGKVCLCYAAAVGHTDVVSYLMRKDHNTQHLMEDQRVGPNFPLISNL